MQGPTGVVASREGKAAAVKLQCSWAAQAILGGLVQGLEGDVPHQHLPGDRCRITRQEERSVHPWLHPVPLSRWRCYDHGLQGHKDICGGKCNNLSLDEGQHWVQVHSF